MTIPLRGSPLFPPGGTADDRTSGYDSFTGLPDYETFFDAVNIDGLLDRKAEAEDTGTPAENGGE